MRDRVVLFLHLLVTVARLAGPGGARAVAVECARQAPTAVLNRSRKRSPKLCLSDRVVAGLCALLMRPRRLIRAAIVLKPCPSRIRGQGRRGAERSPDSGRPSGAVPTDILHFHARVVVTYDHRQTQVSASASRQWIPIGPLAWMSYWRGDAAGARGPPAWR
jgi:hypothetical protein